MSKGFVLRQDAIMMSLVSHAKHVLESKELDKHDKRIIVLSKHIINYFVKKSKVKYTRAQAAKVNAYLKEYIEPNLQPGTSSVIFMVLCFDYLMVENKHIETCKIFINHIKRINEMIDELETTENREQLYKHYQIFVKGMLKGEEVFSNKWQEYLNKGKKKC